MEREHAMEAGLREAAPAAPQGTARRGRRRAEARRGMHGEGGAEKRTRAILSGVWYHFIEKVLDLM